MTSAAGAQDVSAPAADGPGHESDGTGGAMSLSDRVSATLMRQILSGRIATGSWLRHGALAEQFGISRTPVREALRTLAAQGVVTIVPHRGARVNGRSASDLREIGDVRAQLEGLAAFLAAQRMNDEQNRRMTQAWRSFRERQAPAGEQAEDDSGYDADAEEWALANDAFHSVVLEAAGNRYLSMTMGDLRRHLPHNLSYAAYAGNSRLLAKNLSEHQAIAEAIDAQDGELARRLMTEHIRASVDATARCVERQDTDRAG